MGQRKPQILQCQSSNLFFEKPLGLRSLSPRKTGTPRSFGPQQPQWEAEMAILYRENVAVPLGVFWIHR